MKYKPEPESSDLLYSCPNEDCDNENIPIESFLDEGECVRCAYSLSVRLVAEEP